VILNHVKEGIELARKNRLNQKIVDFIPQHHGTGLIFYFYQRALEEANGEKIDEENYRYPGPKPQARETAIVMLADSVEGATRAMEEHSPSRIDDVVRKVINNKFIDGQLDECNLTLRDIEVIGSTFTRVLTAMYHGRVKYPDKKANGHHNKKSADENPHPPEQN
jgi:membrane-associated HD superfamily phosphohydrolase